MLAQLVVEYFSEKTLAGEATVLGAGGDDLVEDHLEGVHLR